MTTRGQHKLKSSHTFGLPLLNWQFFPVKAAFNVFNIYHNVKEYSYTIKTHTLPITENLLGGQLNLRMGMPVNRCVITIMWIVTRKPVLL